MEITLEEIQKKFESLPEDLKWAIMAAKVDDNIIAIGQAQNLTVEQMGQLSLETHMVMFGFTHPNDFEKSVKASMGLPDDKTRALVNAVNEKILKEIREKMMNLPANTPQKAELHEKINIGDAKILNSAGIEIVPAGNTPDEVKLKQDLPSILSQKLSSSVQVPSVKTEHTLNNPTNSQSAPAGGTPPVTPPKTGYSVDPYRMKPE